VNATAVVVLSVFDKQNTLGALGVKKLGFLIVVGGIVLL